MSSETGRDPWDVRGWGRAMLAVDGGLLLLVIATIRTQGETASLEFDQLGWDSGFIQSPDA